MQERQPPRLCHLYLNSPEHPFDQALQAQAEGMAAEATRGGFPIAVRVRSARGDEKVQMGQMDSDRRSAECPDLVIVIPIQHEAIYPICADTLSSNRKVSVVILHQRLTPVMLADRQRYGRRLFSVSADQQEIGRLQARQFAALLPEEKGDILYVQGSETSYGTKQRMKGLLEELPRTPGVRLNGFRVYGDWSPESVKPAVAEWEGRGGRLEWLGAAGAQSDSMALALHGLLREHGVGIPVIGVDGLDLGQRAVDEGTLAATVIQPLGVGYAIDVYRRLCADGVEDATLIPEDGNIVLSPTSYPALDFLVRRHSQKQ
jgi:ABC-type sugar transport system substrate-binding protein